MNGESNGKLVNAMANAPTCATKPRLTILSRPILAVYFSRMLNARPAEKIIVRKDDSLIPKLPDGLDSYGINSQMTSPTPIRIPLIGTYFLLSAPNFAV